MLKSSLIKLHAAAAIFVANRGNSSAQQIADILKIPRNSVYHLAKQPEWNLALDALDFRGDRHFDSEKRGRKKKTESGDALKLAKIIYTNARKRGLKHSRAVNEVLKDVYEVKDRRTINTWVKRFNWEDTLKAIDTDN